MYHLTEIYFSFHEKKIPLLWNLSNIYQFDTHEVKSRHVKQFFLFNSKTYRNERCNEGTKAKHIYTLTWSDFRPYEWK